MERIVLKSSEIGLIRKQDINFEATYKIIAQESDKQDAKVFTVDTVASVGEQAGQAQKENYYYFEVIRIADGETVFLYTDNTTLQAEGVFNQYKMQQYKIFNDLSNNNRKRVDLLQGATMQDVKELQGFDIEIQESFQNGAYTTHYVLLADKVTSIVEANTEALKEALNDKGIDYQVDYFGDCNQILVEGWQHQIYISIDEDGYSLSTLHMEQSKHYGIYDELYRNQTTRKTSKAVITYVYKFL